MPSTKPLDAGRQLHPRLAAPIKEFEIPLGPFTPNATKTTLAKIFDREAVIREIWFAGDAIPNDADGTMLIHVDNFDASENALDPIVVGFDTEAQLTVAKVAKQAVLAVESAENELTVQAGDTLQFRQVNNSAAIDLNANIVAHVLYQVLALVEG